MKRSRAWGASLRICLSDLESMHLRQVDIEQNQIRLQLFGLLNGLQPIRRLDGLELRPSLKRRANEMAERRMVLDDENPQRHLAVSSVPCQPIDEGINSRSWILNLELDFGRVFYTYLIGFTIKTCHEPGEVVVYDPHMRRTRASARWMRFALAFALALGLAAMSGAAQQFTILTNGRNLQIPINHGLPDKPLGFTFCRLRYENIRRARKSGWGDDYPQADYNFMVRLAELTTTTISRWNNGYPGFANVTAMDPDLFRCPYLRMQNAANYDFTPEETARMHDYLLKGGFLWIDDNWDPDFEYIRPNLMRILPGAKIVDLPVEHPMFSILYRVNPLPQIPSLGSWQRTRQDSEIGPSTVHYYGVFDDHDRLLVLVSMNSDVSDSWEREGDNQDYFETFAAKGYALGVNVAVWVMTH